VHGSQTASFLLVQTSFTYAPAPSQVQTLLSSALSLSTPALFGTGAKSLKLRRTKKVRRG